jgi:hypothetical protein
MLGRSGGRRVAAVACRLCSPCLPGRSGGGRRCGRLRCGRGRSCPPPETGDWNPASPGAGRPGHGSWPGSFWAWSWGSTVAGPAVGATQRPVQPPNAPAPGPSRAGPSRRARRPPSRRGHPGQARTRQPPTAPRPRPSVPVRRRPPRRGRVRRSRRPRLLRPRLRARQPRPSPRDWARSGWILLILLVAALAVGWLLRRTRASGPCRGHHCGLSWST